MQLAPPLADVVMWRKSTCILFLALSLLGCDEELATSDPFSSEVEGGIADARVDGSSSDADAAENDPGGGNDDATSGMSDDDVLEAYCRTKLRCWGARDDIAGYTETDCLRDARRELGYSTEDSPACHDATIATFGCLAELDCARFDAFYAEERPASFSCGEEEGLFLQRCSWS